MINKLINKVAAPIFIQTKKTPNPDFLKFVPGSHVVMGDKDPVDIATE